MIDLPYEVLTTLLQLQRLSSRSPTAYTRYSIFLDVAAGLCDAQKHNVGECTFG